MKRRSTFIILAAFFACLSSACQRHEPSQTMAFWNSEVKYELIKTKQVPQHERFYYDGAKGPHYRDDNRAEPEKYFSSWRQYILLPEPGSQEDFYKVKPAFAL